MRNLAGNDSPQANGAYWFFFSIKIRIKGIKVNKILLFCLFIHCYCVIYFFLSLQKQKTMRWFITFCVIIFFIGCKSDGKKNVDKIPDEKFIEVIIDLHLGDALLETGKFDPQDKKYHPDNFYAAILKKHNVTREEFDKTLDYFADYPGELMKIYDKVLEELSKKQGKNTGQKKNNPAPVNPVNDSIKKVHLIK
ncbi:MAG: hypothetical protein A2W91_00530 [Bacteroidetes bacterium GWF2_38_335]|nr:MAG: hypothetical protein A2W91_00530 [Bacteroidetes bacterium GWF2_38_335]